MIFFSKISNGRVGHHRTTSCGEEKVLQFVHPSKKSLTICPSLISRLALSTAAARPCHNFEIARIGIECPMYSWLADVNHQSSTNPRGTQPISTNKLKVPHHYHQTNMNLNQSNIKSSASTIRHYRLQNRNIQLCIFGGTCERDSIALNKTKWPRQVRELILDSVSEISYFWSFDKKK